MTESDSLSPYPESLVAPTDDMAAGADTLARVVLFAARAELQECSRILHHCLHQLTQDQVWSRPDAGQNAIGNLLLHLEGNLRQWIVVGLTDGSDSRNRNAEFTERNALAASELLQRLDGCIDEALTALTTMSTAADLLQPRRIQGFSVHGVAALQHAIAHFRGHTQEIVGRTRQLLGDRYRFAWTPQTVEQGAAT